MLMIIYFDQPIKTFVKSNEFEMSMTGELSYFLGLQIKQLKNGTFMSQGKYIKDMLKKFDMNDSKAINTPMGKMTIQIVMQVVTRWIKSYISL